MVECGGSGARPSVRGFRPVTPKVDAARLLARMDAFAAIGATPKGGVNRQALSPEDRQARAMLAEIAAARGFALRQDTACNLFARRAGIDADLPPLLIGSHLDSQPTGGRFDGALGVLAALEVLEALSDAGVSTPRPVELVSWTNEEGSRFQPGALGSRAFVEGGLRPEWLKARDKAGTTLEAALRDTLAALPGVCVERPGHPIAAYLELHIEQGPVLEREGIAIGAVTGIQGTRWYDVTYTGSAAHAGTTPLAFRRDPMAAASAALADLFRTIMPGDEDVRLTVGRISASPGSINAVPAEVRFSIDLRHPTPQGLARHEASVRAVLADAARDHGCSVDVVPMMDMAAVAFPETMVELVEEGARSAGASHRRILSGAFHDATFIAGIAPAAMLFSPCRDGVSHNEAEFVDPAGVVCAAEVLLTTCLLWLK